MFSHSKNSFSRNVALNFVRASVNRNLAEVQVVPGRPRGIAAPRIPGLGQWQFATGSLCERSSDLHRQLRETLSQVGATDLENRRFRAELRSGGRIEEIAVLRGL